MGSHTETVTGLPVCLMGSHTENVTRQAIRLVSSYTDNIASWAVCLMGLQELSRLMFDEYFHCLLGNLCKRPSPINVLKLRQIASDDRSQAYGCCCWSLLYSAVLRSPADSLRSHVILHEWLAYYSAFLNIHRSGVLTAMAWLVPHETAAVSARSVYTIQPCTMSLHAKPHT